MYTMCGISGWKEIFFPCRKIVPPKNANFSIIFG
jgi:hypothetical protein